MCLHVLRSAQGLTLCRWIPAARKETVRKSGLDLPDRPHAEADFIEVQIEASVSHYPTDDMRGHAGCSEDRGTAVATRPAIERPGACYRIGLPPVTAIVAPET